MRNQEYVCIIGGTNVDIQGFSCGKFKFKDSNPGFVKSSPGGVGRNIGENLARMGVHVKLISAVGDDENGHQILKAAEDSGLDMDDTLVVKDGITSTYLSILDEGGDMAAAVSDMAIMENINVDFIKSKKHIIRNSRLCIIDTNLSGEAIEYIVKENSDNVFFLDTVSTAKADRVKDIIGSFHTIKPNKMEAEVLTGIKIRDESDMKRASEYFLASGVKRVFITLGGDGVYYSDGQVFRHYITPDIKVINATGAGDAFTAALAYCYMEGSDIDYTSKFACSASMLALSHPNTINLDISVEAIKSKMMEVKFK